MLSNAMAKSRPAPADNPPPTPGRQSNAGDVYPDKGYPDKLDARLLRISGVCILATIMAILDITVVSVAQRTFINQKSLIGSGKR